MDQQASIPTGCSKSLFSKAAASEEARRSLRYVEPLSDARTMLADFFSILIMLGWAAGRWPAAATSTIGGTVAETGEADGDGGAFARLSKQQ